eukprot:9147651-Ditylum_brightwellii.AAC.1
MRDFVLQHHLAGFDKETVEICLMWNAKKYPCKQTIACWITQYKSVGHVLPYHQNGSIDATREIRDLELAELALF